MTRALLLIAAGLLPACIAYNPDCPVDTSAVAGVSDVALDVRRSLLRTQEAPIGNLIADALHDYLVAQPVPSGKAVDFALINAGAIRDVSECASVEQLGPGPITLTQLDALLPFDNDVELVEVTGEELLRSLEHGVSRLGEAGEWGLGGQFLQVSHLRFAVDCSRTAAVGGDIVGSRIVDGQVTLQRDDGSEELLDRTQRYQLATITYLVDGGDGFEGLSRRVPLGELELDRDVVVVANYLDAHESVAPQVEGRIAVDPNCTVAR